MITTLTGQSTVNEIVLDTVVPPSAVMVNVTIHVPVEMVGKVTVLPDDVIPVPEAA